MTEGLLPAYLRGRITQSYLDGAIVATGDRTSGFGQDGRRLIRGVSAHLRRAARLRHPTPLTISRRQHFDWGGGAGNRIPATLDRVGQPCISIRGAARHNLTNKARTRNITCPDKEGVRRRSADRPSKQNTRSVAINLPLPGHNGPRSTVSGRSPVSICIGVASSAIRAAIPPLRPELPKRNVVDAGLLP